MLKAQRKEWLAIDIKPYIGDRTYDVTQHLLNSLDRVEKDPIGLLTKISKTAEVDKYRLLKWTQARLLSENNGLYQALGKKIGELNL